MKSRFLLAALCVALAFVNIEAQNTRKLTIGGKTFTFTDGLTLRGDQPANLKGAVGTCTFTAFPSTVNEFKQLRSKIGQTFTGCAVLNLMAYEMYRRDPKVGEECIRLISVSSEANSTIRMLAQKFPKQRIANPDDSYMQPYLVASYLEGAEQENKYQPNEPYKITIRWDANPNMKQHERSNMLYGYIYRLTVDWIGGKTRSFSILVPDDDDDDLNYRIHNGAGLYVGIPNIRKWNDTLK